MTGEDPRWTRSRAALIAAVTSLIDAGESPTITDVVHRAGVSRPTFYQHFGDLPTALSAAALARVESQFVDVASPAGVGVDINLTRKTITALLRHLHDHRVFYRAVLSDSSARRFTESVVEFVANRILTVSPLRMKRGEETTVLTADRVAVMAAGLVWLITQWLKRSDGGVGADPISVMADRLVAVMESFGTASVQPAFAGDTNTPQHGLVQDDSSLGHAPRKD
ncbi:AcrR family transcriptional regulator [Okibacterium sp. HSC-33S16]|uniref:TetR/AcrR family transcriptional regulator n=1 Tax=Okibacterium sp. HSC-33S16 TaxID=2910965 RepID=UPI00209CCE48|nr:TetR/AcrR family transcriptional regulator [Okibacterium sp. HSC-33S16]MCP2030610.1 AcrR family transcriptional regulator [Okibacterium sp. HSC-33S16]